MPSQFLYTENGNIYSFDDVFVPADPFRVGNLYIWGGNLTGQLGINNIATRLTPVTTFLGGTNWKQVSAGSLHTAAVRPDGILWNWGFNSYGQLGDNTTTYRSTPVTNLVSVNNWRSVACGRDHTCGIKTNGNLWTWGRNNEGQLGDNTTTNRITPITIFSSSLSWKDVEGGTAHTVAIQTDGTIWGWGRNVEGQIGDGTNTQRNAPTRIGSANDWKQISCGGYQTSAIKKDGSLWVWGKNNFGQLGTNDKVNRLTPVTTYLGGNDWKQVSVGGGHIAAVKVNGTLWLWGRNTEGQLGDNTGLERITPITLFGGGTNWKSVSSGNAHTAAIKGDGTLWLWGYNSDGQIGDNTNINRLTPVTTFFGGNSWKQVASGSTHTVAVLYSDNVLGL